MKNIPLMMLALMMFGACATGKKAASESTVAEYVSSETESSKDVCVTFTDTTKRESGKVTITEVEFVTTGVVYDGGGFPVSPEESTPSPTVTELDLPGVGKIKGTVKSLKQTTIESGKEQKGESRDSTDSRKNRCDANANIVKSNKSTEEEPTPDPYRWRYIFGTAVLAAVVLLYIKRQPIIDWLRKILLPLRRIF